MQYSQFSLTISSEDASAEEFAIDLRSALVDAGALRVERLSAGAAPENARGIEIIAAIGLFISIVQTAESINKAVQAIRQVAARYAKRRKEIRVSVDGVPTDLATADDSVITRLVTRLAALPTQTHTSKRHALIVTNGSYQDTALTQLRAPAHDGAALARVLGNPAIGDFTVDQLHDADERTIRRRLSGFLSNRDRDDVLLIHYSGHGVKDVLGKLYLAAHDTELNELAATGVRSDLVSELISQTAAQRVILILDCCYAGAYAKDMVPRSSEELNIAAYFGAGSGRIVITASSAEEYAFETGALAKSDGAPSAFTSAFVDGLETGAADLNSDGEISIDELYEYVHRRVRETTPGQTPRRYVHGQEGTVIVARSPAPIQLPQDIVDNLAVSIPEYRLVAVASLKRLLSGRRAALRTMALNILTDVRDNDDSNKVRVAAADALAAHSPAMVFPQPDAPMPQPVVAPPVEQNPVVAVETPAADQPMAAAQPVVAQPVVAEPVVAQPAPARPVAAQPVAAQPMATEPGVVPPVAAARPVAAQPVADIAPKVPEAQPVVAQRVAGTRPVSGARPIVGVGPAGMADSAGPQRLQLDNLLLVAGVLAVLSVLLKLLIGAMFGWISVLLPCVQIGILLTAFITKRPVWAALFIGLLTANLISSIPGHGDANAGILPTILTTATFVLLTVVLLRDRQPARWRLWVRVVTSVIAYAALLFACLTIIQLHEEAFEAPSPDDAISYVALLLWPVAPAVFVMLAPAERVTRFVLIGWALGALVLLVFSSLVVIDGYFSSSDRQEVTLAAVSLPAAVGLLALLMGLQRRKA